MFKNVRVLMVAIPLVVVLVLGVMTLNAQEEDRRLWWRSPETANQLQLTDSEIEQLERAFEAYRLKTIELRSRVEAEQFKLRTLLERSDLDESAAWTQQEGLEKARSELADERFNFLLEVRKIVGHERFQRLMEMREAKRQERKRR